MSKPQECEWSTGPDRVGGAWAGQKVNEDAKALMIAASFGRNESKSLEAGGACRSEALKMALFDQALWRPSRNTPMRAARSMRSRFALIAASGRAKLGSRTG